MQACCGSREAQYHTVIHITSFSHRVLYIRVKSNAGNPMSHLTYLYPYIGSNKEHVIYHKSASAYSYHYFILVSDPHVFKRTGIRTATFCYNKEDVRYENPVVRYGNTSPKVRLPNLRFEAAIKDAIRCNEGVYNSIHKETPLLQEVQTRLEGFIHRVSALYKKKKFGSS